jgi:hypothetical protein
VHLIEAAERSLELCGRCANSTAVTRAEVEGVGVPGGFVGAHADLE